MIKELRSKYSIDTSGSTVMVVAHKYREAVLKSGMSDPEAFIRNNNQLVEISGGRGKAYIIPLSGSFNGNIVIKHYEHGGVLSGVFKDIYIGFKRQLKELLVMEKAKEAGLPVPEAVALCVKRVLGMFSKCWLLSRELPQTVPLIEKLKQLKENYPERFQQEKEKLLKAVAGLIRRFHHSGVYHRDLNVNNILVRGGDGCCELFLVDFDKARITEMNSHRREKNISRLKRSIRKYALKEALMDEKDIAFFINCYNGIEVG
jgi:3-deoxy-D-manno-octulosonic acid kinase